MGKLHTAATQGNLDEIKKLLKGGFFSKPVNINELNDSYETALDCAIRAGHLHVVQYLHENAGRCNSDSKAFRETAGREACYAVVKYSIENMKPTKQDLNEGLERAAQQCSVKMMELLLNAGAELTYETAGTSYHLSENLLQIAVNAQGSISAPSAQYVDAVKWLIKRFADANRLTLESITKITDDNNKKTEIYDFFIDTYCKKNTPHSLMIQACLLGDVFLFERMKAKKIPIDMKAGYEGNITLENRSLSVSTNSQGFSVISAASGQPHLLKWLVNNGEDLNTVTTNDKLSLYALAEKGKSLWSSQYSQIQKRYDETLVYISIIYQENNKKKAVHAQKNNAIAASADNTRIDMKQGTSKQIYELLTSDNVAIMPTFKQQLKKNNLLVFLATDKEKRVFVRFRIDNNTPDGLSVNGNSHATHNVSQVLKSVEAYLNPDLQNAAQTGDLARVQEIATADAKLGISVNKKNKDGEIALLLAAQMGHLSIVQYLIEHAHADLNQTDADDETVFDYANKCRDTKKRDLILTYLNSLTETETTNLKLTETFKKARAGDMQAQLDLAYIYIEGNGVKQSDAKAVFYFGKAAAQGNAQAQSNLGFMYANGRGVAKNEEKAAQLYQEAALQGDANAQNNLAVAYLYGNGVKKDLKEAFEWATKAADQNDSGGYNTLGTIYDDQEDAKKDLTKALFYYEKAATLGDMFAQFNLGRFYEQGLGNALIDEHKALALYQQSAEQGYEAAQQNLQRLRLKMQKKSRVSNNPATSSHTPTNSSLLTNPAIQQHHAFLATLSFDTVSALEALGKQGSNLNNALTTLTSLTSGQQNLAQRLEALEAQAGLDAQSQAEIAYIKQHEYLWLYFNALKQILGNTFFAAKTIASGEVDATETMTTTAVKGMSTVAGAICPPAAPFLSFAATMVGVIGGIATGREMKMLSGWIDAQTMIVMTVRLACELTLAQEQILKQGLNAKAKKNLKFIQDHCTLLVERIKSGKDLTLEESRALLDANEVLIYMKENDKPKNASPTDCVAVLVAVIMGEDYVYVSAHGTHPAQQTTTPINTSAQSQSVQSSRQYPINEEQWYNMQKMAEKAVKDAESAKQEAAEAHKKLAALQKQNASSHAQSSHYDNGDGTVSLQQNIVSNTANGAVPLDSVVASMAKQLAQQDAYLGTLAPIVNKLNQQYENNNGTMSTTSGADSEVEERARLGLFGVRHS